MLAVGSSFATQKTRTPIHDRHLAEITTSSDGGKRTILAPSIRGEIQELASSPAQPQLARAATTVKTSNHSFLRRSFHGERPIC